MQIMMRGLCLILALAASGRALCSSVLEGEARSLISIPVNFPDGRKVLLEGLAARPDRPGRFPLILLVHSTPRGGGSTLLKAIAGQSPTSFESAAVAFAQRGYAAVAIMRRGFGRSEGPYQEAAHERCEDREYGRQINASGDDVLGAIASLRQQDWVDPDRIVVLGVSTGGLAVLAAASTNPHGVVGVVNFSGGRGSIAPDTICNSGALVRALEVIGRTTQLPTLWIYAENDHYFGPAIARRMFDAFGGSSTTRTHFEMVPPVGDDGHSLFLTAPQIWWPPVTRFLKDLQLPTEEIVELHPMNDLPSPKYLNGSCEAAFRRYTTTRTDIKAFAVNSEGHCGFAMNARSIADATSEAKKQCNLRGQDCRLYAVGQNVVGEGK